jgi:hypothetical protein
MGLYCAYVGCFWVATGVENLDKQRAVAYVGAAVGGVGAGFLWTSQGAYFSKAAEDHAAHLLQPVSRSTSYLAGIFAFIYLSEELLLRVLSTILAGFLSWDFIFGLYTVIAVTATMAMPLVPRYPTDGDDENDPTRSTVFYKVTAAGQLLWRDPKMKYMIGLNAVFGFASAFLNSYVNGEVVPVALNDPDSKYVGMLSAGSSATAAVMSMVFGRLVPSNGGNGTILILGALCFFAVVFPFLVQPDASKYGWTVLIMVYAFHGMGRATFEGTLKATFADYFSYEKEGAFANIILQNGFASAIGYFCKFHRPVGCQAICGLQIQNLLVRGLYSSFWLVTISLVCEEPSRYCIKYRSGTLHDVLTFEMIVLVSAILAIVGYLRASAIFRTEQHPHATTAYVSVHTVDEERDEELSQGQLT